MNKEVGLENLPNCYIKTIEISELNSRKNRVTISVIVKDTEFEDSLYWYDDDSISSHLDVVVLGSSNKELTDALNTGKLPLDTRKIRSLLTRNSNANILQKPALTPDFKYKQDELHSFEYIFKMEIPKDTTDFTVFSCVSMNVRKYALQQKIDLSSNRINSYTGPVSSELVLQNSNIIEETTAFFLPSGEVHAGPVHEHNNTFMEGSYHTERPHAVLTRRTLSNSKIKDYRSVKQYRPNKSPNERYKAIEGPWLSHNDEGDLYGFFTLDYKNILISKTLLGYKIAKLSEGLFDSLLAEFKFKNIEIFNEKFVPMIKSVRGTPRISKKKLLKKKSLIKSKQRSGRLQKRKRKNIMMEELPLNSSLQKRTFSFVHRHSDNMKGHYNYGLELSFNDPTYKFVEDLLFEMKTNIGQFNPYFVRSNRPSSVVLDSSRLSQDFINTELGRFVNEETAPWNLAILNYVKNLSLLRSLTDEETSTELHKATTQAHPKYATPKSLEFFYKSYKSLYVEFLKYFKVKPKNNSDIKGGNTKRQPKNSISFRISFKDVISFEDKDKNLNYFDNNRDGLPIMTKEEFVENSRKEFQKFFKEKPSFNRTQISTVGKEETNAMSKVDNNLVSYMTPKKIKLKKKKIMLNKKPVSFNIKEVNDAVDALKSVKKADVIQPKKNKKTKFTIRNAKPIASYLDKKENKTKSTRENLGKDTSFNNAEEKIKITPTKSIKKEIKKTFMKKPKLKKKIQKDSFKVSNKIVEKIITNKRKAERLPISLKAVIGSESQSVRNNLLKSRKDQISSRKSADIFDVMYTSPMEVQYYTKGKWQMIDSKKLSAITESVVCRIEPFSVQGLTEKEDKMNISCKYFVLEVGSFNPQSRFTALKMSSVLSKIDELSRIKGEYYTNNPVKQSPQRIGSLTTQTVTQSSTEELVNNTSTRIIQRSSNAY